MRTEITRNINRRIEREMAARAVKFEESLEMLSADPRDVARAGGKKPGNRRNN